MMTTLLQIVLALAIITTVVDSAAIGDIARNVHSDLLTLDAGLNPQPVRSPRQDFDVPAGMLTLTPFFHWKVKQRTVFENHRKSLIQHCERSELRLHFEWTKVNQKWSILVIFWKPEACGQTVLPNRSILVGQKLVENAKYEKMKCNILG